MGKIITGFFMPHPPVLLPEIGRGREQQISTTSEAADRIADEISRLEPDTIILSTPHAPCFRDFFYITRTKNLRGSFANFGRPELEFAFENDLPLAEDIIRQAERVGLPAGFLDHGTRERLSIDEQLDHGALVPLYYVWKKVRNFKLVLLSTPMMDPQRIFKFGQCIADAVTASDRKVVYIASGDLSHGLTEDAPAGLLKQGAPYDRRIKRIIETNDIHDLLEISQHEMQEAAECGTRSLVMMYGALDGCELESQVLSYEGPFGVGYLCASLINLGKRESEYVQLARETIEVKIRENKTLAVPAWVPESFFHRRAGTFVSLKKRGLLRGCIGTIAATRKNIAEEIIQNAISAATQDPRFPPLSESELGDLSISVDILGEAEPVQSISELDPQRYGVIVSSGFRRGLLLPALEGVDTVEQQLTIALEKAGISPDESYRIERFEVVRYV